MSENQLPNGWDEQRIQSVLTHYVEQTEEEALLEDETAFAEQTQAVMEIPFELVPAVRELLAKYYGDSKVAA